ncbi:MAG: sugar phosphate isomerase/epimerase [Flavobacteriaceae bacterium]|nr:sugar phosphate isomerase/epimerase [Bacteroidia bacterium]MBT8286576.1 sugar phosphate isomerase/epimerase [Bacteroidia bacterium]NNF75467.1 sugar phosphate isomerase/epimerase [Flavobacteriaceae bacterium]NNK73936.1 sugar phosphate isomerase/epimerase [Flavobacteriaceae bacterium]
MFTMTCKDESKNSEQTKDQTEVMEAEMNTPPFFKLSLAQWSIHNMIMNEGVDPFDFAKLAKSWGFEGIEYVSQLYSAELAKYESPEAGMQELVNRLNKESQKAGIENLLIMVDDEGGLADPDEAKRNQAVENHKKWVDAAAALGCHSIRVNTFGTNDPEVWMVTVVDGLKKLSEYAATKNINVLCENHGWLSSDAPKMMQAIKDVNMANCGSLPDFGNWCIKRKAGENWGECLETYPDKYEGIKILMPSAMAVSAKSYDFDADGNETTIDYVKMLQIVKDAGYTGYIGVEYEGNRLSEEDGILATKNLLIKAAR